MIEAYPLCWPHQYPRVTARKNSRFKITLGSARDFVKNEIRRIGGTDPVISTSIPLKNDGDLRADWSRYKLDDPGVAVYFMRNKQQVCLCCDNYERVWENLYAVGRTIEALRQIDRDGVSDFLNRTFTGFTALPETSTINQKSIYAILGLTIKPESAEQVHQAYKQRSRVVHPDIPGGSAEAFHELTQAYKIALSQFNTVQL